MNTWVNGSLVEPGRATLRADDRGVLDGDGIFETMKVVDGAPFALTRHLRRLESAAEVVGLAVDLDLVHSGITAILHAEPMRSCRLRVTITGGSVHPGTDASAPTVIVQTTALPDHPDAIDVCVVPWTRNERGATAGLKTTSYVDNVIAFRYAEKQGAGEAIFANTRGELCEGARSNVFVAIEGRLHTPPLAAGCLPGVTRGLLVEWLGDVVEAPIPIDALAHAEEAFLSSSLRGAQAIRSVDGDKLPHLPGPLTMRAIDVYAQRCAELDP